MYRTAPYMGTAYSTTKGYIMFKFLVIILVAGQPQMQITHPFEFTDKASCEAFVELDWKINTRPNSPMKAQPKCIKIADEA